MSRFARWVTLTLTAAYGSGRVHIARWTQAQALPGGRGLRRRGPRWYEIRWLREGGKAQKSMERLVAGVGFEPTTFRL